MQWDYPYLTLGKCFYEHAKPDPLEQAYAIDINKTMLEEIGLDLDKDEEIVRFINGENHVPLQTYATVYAGFQFGHYVPCLGDGRVVHFGTMQGWHVQVKGSAETAFARGADGRCSLFSSLREYTMSEAMHALGIPTTRVVGLVGSHTKIVRSTIEDAALVMRASPSWVRFGTLEYFYYRRQYEELEALLAYSIQESYPHLKDRQHCYEELLESIVRRSAELVAHWQSVGFCHGVMNTDNMSVAGFTLDYGPFAMMDRYDFGYVCNQNDKAGRYRYGDQPNVMYWNVMQLAKTFEPFLSKARSESIARLFEAYYIHAFIDRMRQKLGLYEMKEEDRDLIVDLVGSLQDAHVDYTLFFRALSRFEGDRHGIYDLAFNPEVLVGWLDDYEERLKEEGTTSQVRHQRMLATNPKYSMRTHLLDQAYRDVKSGNASPFKTLLALARHPFDEHPSSESFANEPPYGLGNEIIACLS